MSTPHTSSSPESIWAASDKYHNARLIRPDAALEAAVRASDSLDPIAVSAAQGKLLKLLALSIGAARVLGVATLGGYVVNAARSHPTVALMRRRYSTIWMAQAIKDKEGARIVSCEVDDRHAHVARENLKNAGFVPPFAEIIVGSAHDTLKAMHVEIPFDMVAYRCDARYSCTMLNLPKAFIDADKKNNTNYVIEAKCLLRTGGIIVRFFRAFFAAAHHVGDCRQCRPRWRRGADGSDRQRERQRRTRAA
jgi:predicted O-methyltransferase YrrM